MKNFKVVVCGVLGHGKSIFCNRIYRDFLDLKMSEVTMDESDSPEKTKCSQGTQGQSSLWQLHGQNEDYSRVYYMYTNSARIEVIDHFGAEKSFDKLASSLLTADHVCLVIDAQKFDHKLIYFYLKMALRLTRGQISILVNKMDLLKWNEDKFNSISQKVQSHVLDEEQLRIQCIPLSATHGDNVCGASKNMPWFKGNPVLQSWKKGFAKQKRSISKTNPFFYVQQASSHKGKTLLQGILLQGKIKIGDDLHSLPDRKRVQIQSIFTYDQSTDIAEEGRSVTLLVDQPAGQNCQFLSKDPMEFHIAQKVTARLYLWDKVLTDETDLTMKYYSRVFPCKIEEVINSSQRSGSLVEAVVKLNLKSQLTYQKIENHRVLGTFSVCDPVSGRPVGLGIL